MSTYRSKKRALLLSIAMVVSGVFVQCTGDDDDAQLKGSQDEPGRDARPEDAPEPKCLQDIKASAVEGNVASQVDLACMYTCGVNVSEDIDKAIYWIERAAASDHPQALFWHGMLYSYGLGIEQNDFEALSLLRAAYDLNIDGAEAELTLAKARLRARDSKYRELRWLAYEARGGDVDAQYELGRRYCKGEKAPRYFDKGQDWLYKAHESGSDQAGRLLGDMQARVSRYIERASRGDTSAKFELGVMYLAGDGVPWDLERAEKWFREAAEDGYLAAADSLEFFKRQEKPKSNNKNGEADRPATIRGITSDQWPAEMCGRRLLHVEDKFVVYGENSGNGRYDEIPEIRKIVESIDQIQGCVGVVLLIERDTEFCAELLRWKQTERSLPRGVVWENLKQNSIVRCPHGRPYCLGTSGILLERTYSRESHVIPINAARDIGLLRECLTEPSWLCLVTAGSYWKRKVAQITMENRDEELSLEEEQEISHHVIGIPSAQIDYLMSLIREYQDFAEWNSIKADGRLMPGGGRQMAA